MTRRVASRRGRASLVLLATTLGACALTMPPVQVSRIGPDAYAMTKRSGMLSDRADELKAQVENDALAYCKAQGRAMAVLDSRVIGPDPPAYSSATVQFRCVPV